VIPGAIAAPQSSIANTNVDVIDQGRLPVLALLFWSQAWGSPQVTPRHVLERVKRGRDPPAEWCAQECLNDLLEVRMAEPVAATHSTTSNTRGLVQSS
jgi:hypothetical protein